MELALIEREAVSTIDQAREIVVTNDEQYKLAGEFIAGCKMLIGKIEFEHADTIKRAHESHKAALALKDSHVRPVKQAIEIASIPALAYKREQDRLAREEAARIAAEQRKAEEERRLKEAEALDAAGHADKADEVLDQPMPVARPIRVESAVPKVQGLSTRRKWKCRLINPQAVSRPYLEPNLKLINIKVDGAFHGMAEVTASMIKALESEIGGVEVYEEETFAGRRM